MDGTPVAHGRIVFARSETDGAPIESAISDGAFTQNLLPGSKKVLIYVYKSKMLPGTDKHTADPKSNLAPARYNRKTELSADVTAAGPNELTFDLHSQ